MEDKVKELYSYIQGRCLWQFFARELDRRANIEAIMDRTAGFLSGEQATPETPSDKYFYVEAKSLAAGIKNKFPWLNEIDEAQKKELIERIKEKLIEVMVIKSQNPELRRSGY